MAADFYALIPDYNDEQYFPSDTAMDLHVLISQRQVVLLRPQKVMLLATSTVHLQYDLSEME